MTGSERARGWLRLARAFALTLIGVLCGAGAHVFAGGGTPGMGLFAAIVLLLTVLSLPLALRRVRLVSAAPLLLVHQLATHIALSETGQVGTQPLATTGHLGHSPGTLLASTGTPHLAHSAMPSITMLVAHVAAAGLLGWILCDVSRAWGEVAMARHVLSVWHRRAGRAASAALHIRVCSVPMVLHGRTHRWVRWHRSTETLLDDLWHAPVPARRGPPLLGH